MAGPMRLLRNLTVQKQDQHNYPMPPTRQEAHRRHAEYYLSVVPTAQFLYLGGGEYIDKGLRLFDSERENVFNPRAWTSEHIGNNGELVIAEAKKLHWAIWVRPMLT